MVDREELGEHVRVGEHPPAMTRLVLRGGPDTLSLIANHARRLNRLYVLRGEEVFGISVFVALDDVGPTSYAELLRNRLRGYPLVYTPAVDDLLAAGFGLLPTFRRPHYTVLMGSLDDTEHLYDTLGELRSNPYAVS
jgi:hypothetical protein